MAAVEGRMIPPSPLTGEGTQVYFRKRRAWEDSQTPISRALATAPQNDICFAPAIRVSLNDSFRPCAGGCFLQTSPTAATRPQTYLNTWESRFDIPQVCHFIFRECPFDPIVMRLFSSLPHNFRLHHQKTDIDDFSLVSSPFVYAWGVTSTPNALRIVPMSSSSASSIM